MRKSYSLAAALSLTTLPVLQAHAAWAPALPAGAGVIAEVDNQTQPLTFPRPDAFDSAGGILGSFNAQSVSRHGVLIKAYPVEVRVSRNARLEVRNLKTGSLITHPTALKAGVTYKYQVSCGAAGWKLVVNGNSQTDSGKNHPTCVSEAWGKPVIGASNTDGRNALAGTIDLTWYTSDGSGATDSGGSGGGDDGGDGGTTGTTTPPAGVAFAGDFETGDVSQWPAIGSPDKLTYGVTARKDGRRGGRFGGRMEVRYMDRGVDANGNPKKVRAEAFEKPVKVGSEWWYGWSSRIDPAWKDQNNTWYIIQQFHQHGMGAPPLMQSYSGGKWSIRCLKSICGNNFILWEQKIAKDVWVDFVYQVRWSPNNDGLIRVWKNGNLIVDRKGPNAYQAKNGPYFKFGIYRGGRDQETQIIWHDEYRRGGNKAAVDPRNYR